MFGWIGRITKAVGFLHKVSKVEHAVDQTKEFFAKFEQLSKKYRLEEIPADLKDLFREGEEAVAAWKDVR